jgi:hypothetical protein
MGDIYGGPSGLDIVSVVSFAFFRFMRRSGSSRAILLHAYWPKSIHLRYF